VSKPKTVDTQLSWGCAHCPVKYHDFVDLRDHWQTAHHINVTIVSVIQ
jgi:hypothetical protein